MTTKRPGSSRAQAKLYARVVAEEPQCWLAYPGICTGTSQTADRITPVSHGGTYTRANLHGACHPCNQHRGINPPPNTDHD